LGISFGSINSGLPKDIVQQIIAAEKIPVQKLQARKAKIENKQTLLNDLTTRVENLKGSILGSKTERSFRELTVDVDSDAISATVDKNLAEPGNYKVEVMQLAQKSSAISNGVEDPDETYLGVGYIQYELPNGEEKEVYIDAANSSLNGIAKLINKDQDNGMTATVVNSGDDSDEPWKMIISLEETGDGQKADFPGLYFVDGEVDLWLDNEREARDAKIKLDGFEIELPSNTATELIPGVTLDLKKITNGEEVNIEITEDTPKVKEKVEDLIKNINDVLTFIKEQNNMDENTDSSQTLGGDLTLQTIESRIRGAVFKWVKTEFGDRRVGDIGITFQRSGLLALDAAKLNTSLEKNYKETAQIMTGFFTEEGKTKGFIDNLEEVAKVTLSRPSGTLFTRSQGLKSNIRDIDRKIENTERRIAKKEENLKQKFARLEETISKIKTQGSGLAGLGGGFNPVQQLG
jgi:flagellar hook-associated protein 2